MKQISETVLFFDLDDTLMSEIKADEAALLAVCRIADTKYGIDSQALCKITPRIAFDIFSSKPSYDYCENNIGLSAMEALWGNISGPSKELEEMHAWVEGYRSEVWAKALEKFNINDPHLTSQLAETFIKEREKNHTPFPDSEKTIEALRKTHRLAIITNGAPCVQQAKLDGSGLEHYFEKVIISGNFGKGKPDPSIFQHACEMMKTTPEKSVYVGNSRSRDIKGAKNAGMKAILVNRTHKSKLPDITPDYEISNLGELINLLQQIAA